MTGKMGGATVVRPANFLMMMEGEGQIEAVAATTTGMNMQEEVGEMIIVEMIETTTVTVMITAETITAGVAETDTDAAPEIVVGAAIGPETGVAG